MVDEGGEILDADADDGYQHGHAEVGETPGVDSDAIGDVDGDGTAGLEPEPVEPIDTPGLDEEEISLHGDVDEGVDAALGLSESGVCVPVSAAMVVSMVTGEETTEQDAVDAADELGLLDGEPGDWDGMTAGEAVVLLERMGVDAHLETGDIDDLRDHLDQGHAAVVAVDSEELWGEGEGEAGADHAVVVVAIDEERGVAIVNDPGVPAGRGVEIPLETLDAAWDDSGHEMVVADEVDDGAGGPFEASDALDSAHVGFVLLPFALGASVLPRRSRQYPVFSNENVSGSYQPPR